jgi:hypothetical protein
MLVGGGDGEDRAASRRRLPRSARTFPGDLPDMAAALYGSMVVSEGRALFLLKC